MGTSAERVSTAYYSEISRMSLVLDPDEEKRLIKAWQTRQDVKARDSIVQSHLRFVVRQAHKRTKDPEAVKDYIAAGNLGLLRAADKFNWKRKPYIRFLTYAGWWVMKEMAEQDYTSSTLVHVPAHRQKEQRRNARAYRAAIQEHGPESEAVQSMNQGLPEGVVVTIEAARNTPDESDYEPTTMYGGERLRALLRTAIARLPPREQTVLNLYYGVKDEPRNLVQISLIMGICPERIRQIKINGMKLLQEDLRDKLGLEPDDAVF